MLVAYMNYRLISSILKLGDFVVFAVAKMRNFLRSEILGYCFYKAKKRSVLAHIRKEKPYFFL